MSDQTGAGSPRHWLIISATYPPHHLGGYELMCRDHVASMRDLGVSPVVLTSSYGVSKDAPHDERGLVGEIVLRALDWHLEGFDVRYPAGPQLWRREWEQQRVLRRTLSAYKPEVAVIWMLLGLSKSLMVRLHEAGIPVIVVVHEAWPTHDFEGDPWTSFWARRPQRLRSRLLKPAARGVVNRLVAPSNLSAAVEASVPVYCSESLRRDVEVNRPEWCGRGVVVHNGIDEGRMSRPRDDHSPLQHPLRLLYAGRVEPRKGVHTAISVIAGLTRSGVAARLRIVGWRDEKYVATLRAQAHEDGVSDLVEWNDPVPHEAMPDIYREADLLLFPTIWAEPFGLAPLEAMATGCVTLATGTGGSGEYLRGGENAILFPPNGAEVAVDAVLSLLESPDLVARLRAGGRATVSRHSIAQTVLAYNTIVEGVLAASRARSGS